MKYENQKLLTELIDKIFLSESEGLASKLKKLQEQLDTTRKQLQDVQKNSKTKSDFIERLSWDSEVIKEYEKITNRYFIADPQVEDCSGQGDFEVVGVNVIETTKELKYPEPKKEEPKVETTEDSGLPF